ncbi:MAG TPA: AIR synthase-related protein [Acidimicrobiia bacterium]|nr:AIR synthase-related protein [Acidimicrobiia bacterium]
MSQGPGDSGLDLNRQDRASAVAYEWAQSTFANRQGRAGLPILGTGGFFANLMDFPGTVIAMTSDGIGTKAELAERTGVYRTLGFDLMAMVVDDLVAVGCEPVNVTNILDVDTVDPSVVDELMHGLHEAAAVARVAVVGGEIAELGDRIRGWGEGMHFNWCATAIGVLPAGRPPLDGRRVAAGDAVVALRSDGFRSNGFSLVRRVMADEFGADWHRQPCDDSTWGRVLLTPSRIYAPLVLDLLAEGIAISGVVHVTGGGVPGNLARLLGPNGLGADLGTLFPPHPLMRELMQRGGVPAEQAYRLWNMGNGMLLTMLPGQVGPCLEAAEAGGYPARVAGTVTPDPAIVLPTEGGGRLAFPGGRR